MTDNKKHILLVDDEERLLNSMAQRILLLGFVPIKASSGIKALEIAKKTRIDLAIVDLKMPDMDGLVTITKLKEMVPDLKTVLLTGYGSEKARQATEALGAMYFEKDAMAGLWDVIKNSGKDGNVFVINPPSYGNTAGLYNEPGDRGGDLPRIIGESPAMQRLRKNIRRFSELDCPIVICGETGTGKELAARTIHKMGYRKNQRFLAFDCGCFSSDFCFKELVASFSPQPEPYTEKGMAFSGTILLDHMENMPLATQQEMLQILDRKPGAGKTDAGSDAMDVRFIVSTQQDLEKKVSHGRFSRDLYQKIRSIELEMPALRDRKEDIPILCRYFLDQFNQAFQKQITSISDAVYRVFEDYAFPGNIRELRHIIESAVILADGSVLEKEHLPRRLIQAPEKSAGQGRASLTSAKDSTGTPFLSLNEMEQQHILNALKITDGNKTKAAEILGISRAALWRKLRIISQKDA
ncbi:MAG: sigma-54 dependent transcriptional regulator [Desulfotignum sp.]